MKGNSNLCRRRYSPKPLEMIIAFLFRTNRPIGNFSIMQRTDGRMNRLSFRDASTHLRNRFSLIFRCFYKSLTDGQMDQRSNGQTNPVIEIRGRIQKRKKKDQSFQFLKILYKSMHQILGLSSYTIHRSKGLSSRDIICSPMISSIVFSIIFKKVLNMVSKWLSVHWKIKISRTSHFLVTFKVEDLADRPTRMAYKDFTTGMTEFSSGTRWRSMRERWRGTSPDKCFSVDAWQLSPIYPVYLESHQIFHWFPFVDKEFRRHQEKTSGDRHYVSSKT